MAASAGSIGRRQPRFYTVGDRSQVASNLRSVLKTVVYGAASVALYALLLIYADETVELARRTREGEKIWFLVPVAVAFLFSLVHGAFTACFWDAIGLRAANKNSKLKE
jgi:hypothetical protein